MNITVIGPRPKPCNCTTHCTKPVVLGIRIPSHPSMLCRKEEEERQRAIAAKEAEVLNFKPKDDGLSPLWMCGCGNKKFALIEGGQIQCWSCRSFQPHAFSPMPRPDGDGSA